MLGDPYVVVEGSGSWSELGWGPYQFSKACYTTNGDIYVQWHMSNDQADPDLATTLAGQSKAVSEDGGKTWRAVTSEDIPVSDVTLSDGSYFAYFNGGGNASYDWLSDYTDDVQKPKADRSNIDLYFAEDIEDFDTKVTFNKVDPETGVKTTVNATFNWPYMPMSTAGTLVHSLRQWISLGNYHSLIEKDGVLYLCFYCYGFDSSASSRETAVTKYSEYYSTYVFKSTDDGATWDYLSQISVTEDIFEVSTSYSGSFEGFGEPMFEVMPDGSVVMLMRTGANQPSYIVRSTDNCKTWSTPVIFDDVGVLPQILTLGCGVTLASYGRPGLFLRSTGDVQGLVWEEATEITLTGGVSTPSCYYTYLLALDDTTALFFYTDCNYPNADGEGKKTVLARTVTVVPADE
ncbi:MAG: exo-alpha-sialidase [Clostridia bacterium]|nr:exo-alpha-sialidase [Clostridia bacterium]